GGAFAEDVVGAAVGVGGHADALALAEGEVVQAAVFAEHDAVGGAHDGAGVVGHVLAQEVLHPDLADEADALAVFFAGGREAGLGGEAAQLGFGEVADGEAGVGELVLGEQREEVGLVLVFVGAFEQGEASVGQRAAA